jgi:hypothetical protein
MVLNLNDFPDTENEIPDPPPTLDVMTAYLNWQNAMPLPGESCCKIDHFIDGVALPDNKVCQRERLWRRYVRLRDSDPNWMPGLLPPCH